MPVLRGKRCSKKRQQRSAAGQRVLGKQGYGQGPIQDRLGLQFRSKVFTARNNQIQATFAQALQRIAGPLSCTSMVMCSWRAHSSSAQERDWQPWRSRGASRPGRLVSRRSVRGAWFACLPAAHWPAGRTALPSVRIATQLQWALVKGRFDDFGDAIGVTQNKDGTRAVAMHLGANPTSGCPKYAFLKGEWFARGGLHKMTSQCTCTFAFRSDKANYHTPCVWTGDIRNRCAETWETHCHLT